MEKIRILRRLWALFPLILLAVFLTACQGGVNSNSSRETENDPIALSLARQFMSAIKTLKASLSGER
jgi:hypothetical protein